MATTTTPPAPTGERRPRLRRSRSDVDAALPKPDRRPATGRQRKWSLALIGVLVTLGSALAFAVLWANAGDRVPVLALAREVGAGQTIGPDDLVVVRLSADPEIDPIRSSRRDAVIGEVARVDLVPGTLLTEGMLGDGDGLAADRAVVGLDLVDGQLPSYDLEAGDVVQVIRTGVEAPEEAVVDGDPGGGGAPVRSVEAGVVVAEGIIRDVVGAESGAAVAFVSLEVDASVAADVAGIEAGDAITLVLVSR